MRRKDPLSNVGNQLLKVSGGGKAPYASPCSGTAISYTQKATGCYMSITILDMNTLKRVVLPALAVCCLLQCSIPSIQPPGKIA